MGLFLWMAGVAGTTVPEVRAALGAVVAERGMALAPVAADGIDPDLAMVLAPSGAGHVSVLFPHACCDAEELCQALSTRVDRPVFLFHIHDDDLWMYSLYRAGQMLDHFCPIPDYWGELDEQELQQERGDADVVARAWPGVAPATIAPYLVRWDLDADELPRAHADDEYAAGDAWQLTDFLRRLGLVYPIDDRGAPVGSTYRMTPAPSPAS